MIEIKNLTKTYNNSKFEVEAIKHLNIKFKDNGFVFIVGKSGCGKSTLLNLMGGLDEVTDGDIICDGNHLVKMKEKELNNFRNNYLGFVFQDYCLIEDLNVYENVALALDIKGGKLSKAVKDELVFKALNSVEIDQSMANRKIKELSGGQKQRVSIARTLIKNPKLILADEPTGNLDSKTTKTILELLKELSKDRLVIIVSHNMEDARIYADRIIELSDGEVVSDIERTGEDIATYSMQNGELTLPSFTRLTEEELAEINEQLKSNNITKISQHSDGFDKTKDIEVSDKKVIITTNKMTGKNSLKLANKFLKKRWFAGIFTIFSIILLVFMLGLCQFLTQFDSAKTISATMIENGETQILAHKGFYDSENDKEIYSKYIDIKDDIINQFVDNGYTGNIFKLYRDPYCWGESYSETEKIVDDKINLKGMYIAETYGTLQCTEEYLVKTFGVNGNLEYLALAETQKPYGILIPDYVADSVLSIKYTDWDYQSIAGTMSSERKYINGVFKTDYKEKYADVLQYLIKVTEGSATKTDRDAIKPKLVKFLYDLKMYYGIAYTTNPNYAEDIKNINGREFAFLGGYEFYLEDKLNKPNQTTFYRADLFDLELGANEVVMEYDVFNNFFGKKINQIYTEENYTEFQPMTLKLIKTDGTYEREIKLYKEITISKLLHKDFLPWSKSEHNVFFASNDVIQDIVNVSNEVYGLIFDDISQIGKIYEILETNTFSIMSRVYSHIKSVGDIVNVFMELFAMLLLVVAFICLLLLVNYGYGNIRKRYQEIGIMKALGASTKSVGFIFGLQTILAGIVISVISTLMLIFLCNPINQQISNRMLEFIGNTELGALEILKPNVITIIINVFVISVITAISSVIPVRKIHKIKPRQIINNK